MYNDKDYNPVYALNSYLRRLLEVNLGWNMDDYGHLDPVIPSAQQPELMQSGKPFIVYAYAEHAAGHLYTQKTASVAYSIYSTSSTEANRVAQLLSRTFERQDDSAHDVNEWLRIEPRDPQRSVFFHTIRMTMVEMAEPSDEEGGFVSALVLCEFRYVLDENPDLITLLSV